MPETADDPLTIQRASVKVQVPEPPGETEAAPEEPESSRRRLVVGIAAVVVVILAVSLGCGAVEPQLTRWHRNHSRRLGVPTAPTLAVPQTLNVALYPIQH